MADDQAEVVIVGDDGTEHVFPAGFDPKKAAAIVKGTVDDETPKARRGGVSSVVAKTVADAAELGTAGLEAFATSPTAKTTASAIARNVTPAATLLSGAVSGGELGGLPGAVMGTIGAIPAATRAGWPMGKVAYRATRALQNVATPIAAGAQAVEPLVRVAGNAVAAAQGPLDLAQAVEPDRKDIGFLGIGRTQSPEEEDAMAIQAMRQIVHDGATPVEAARVISGKDPRKFARWLAAYKKSGAPDDIELPSGQP